MLCAGALMRTFLGQCDSWLSFGKNNQNWYHPNDWYFYTDNYPSCEMFPGVKKYFLPLKSFIKRKKQLFVEPGFRYNLNLYVLVVAWFVVNIKVTGYWILEEYVEVCWRLVYSLQTRDIAGPHNMKNNSLISSVYAALVLSACFIQGYSLPNRSLQRWRNI